MKEKDFRRNIRTRLMSGYATQWPINQGEELGCQTSISLRSPKTTYKQYHTQPLRAPKSCFDFSCLTDTKLVVSWLPHCQRRNSSILRCGWYQTSFGQSAVFLLCPGSQGDYVLLTAAVDPWQGTILGRYAATRTSIWQDCSSLSCFRVSEVVRFSSVSN